MNQEDFELMVAGAHERGNKLIFPGGKGTEYQTNVDVLSNFKTLGEELGISPIVICSIYMKKHHTSIMKAIKQAGLGDAAYIERMGEPLAGRFDDHRNYLLLLEALFRDLGFSIDGAMSAEQLAKAISKPFNDGFQ